jgi:hypothetical protein
MKTLQFKFVEFIPSDLDQDVLYISIEYKTAVHKCVCGCGNKVVTPLTPLDWEIIYDGKTVSLNPSIGNWNFNCKSHYFISRNEIVLARRWNNKEIKENRRNDKLNKSNYYKKKTRK